VVKQVGPASIDVELLKSILEVGSLVLLDQEDVFRFLYAAHAEQKVDLILDRDLHHLVNLTQSQILAT
jgi:hypothetical protein